LRIRSGQGRSEAAPRFTDDQIWQAIQKLRTEESSDPVSPQELKLPEWRLFSKPNPAKDSRDLQLRVAATPPPLLPIRMVSDDQAPTLHRRCRGPSSDQIRIVLRRIIQRGGEAEMTHLYDALEEHMQRLGCTLSKQGRDSLRNFINEKAVNEGYLEPHEKERPGWRITTEGRRFAGSTASQKPR
jgi:hypothetical protein